MFTGIIEEVGRVAAITDVAGGKRVHISAGVVLQDLKRGDSVAVNGVCLTVIDKSADGFFSDVSFETLKKSNLGLLSINDAVNLERALPANGRFSGHIVLGHVDSTGRIAFIRRVGNFYLMRIWLDPSLLRQCVVKGSVAVDGISLTISDMGNGWLEVSLIPHTFETTNLAFRKADDLVNVETDIIGKYVERLLEKDRSGLTIDKLRENGFL